ncbi:MAG: neutral/alkaline non-lysosomal ceramidase N-terminal domain-containing protein [Gemmataceae bacterium]
MRRPAVIALVAAVLAPAAAAAQRPELKVGVAKADITPTHPIRLNGFGSRRAESDGVYQKLWARALAVHDGTAPAVLLAVDVLGIPADVHDELARRLAKKAGLPKERLAVTATHTHTGPMLSGANPTLFGLPIPKEHQANIDKYTPVFLDKLEEAARAALADLKPGKLEWGVGSATFAMNRRTRGGPTDHDLPVLVARDAAGKLRAVYLSYACHAVTLSLNRLGGDWPGYAAAAVEDDHPGAVALVAVGCGADQNPTSGVTGDKLDVASVQGREIAAEVRRLLASPLTRVTGPVTARVSTLDLPLAALPTRAEWEEKAKRADAIGHHARVNLARLDRGEKLPTSVPYPVQTWTFGDGLAMVHLPGEVVVDYSRRLKGELDGRRLWVTAYANHAPCYIPSERVLKEGGYEGGGAMIYYDQPVPFRPGLEDRIVGAVKEQLPAFAAKIDPAKNGASRPLSPHQSLARIRVSAGLKVELAAAEPLVADPVAVAFGPDGKVWVAEMADYPTGRTDGKFDPGGRVVVLEDRDRDGVLDTSTVFLDNLPFPTGLLPWRDGVLVCAAPDILYAADTTGDGKADVVTKLYTGFGTQNYQARVNSLQYGLDGWVHGSCGLFGGNITAHRTGKVHALGDRDFRIKPDTGELEPATGRTQQGRVRDDAGNWFGCDNSTLLKHYALADHYLPRNPAVAYPSGTAVLVGGDRLFPLAAGTRYALSGPPNSVTAACGLGVYRDDLLGAKYTGNAFTCEPVNLLVHRRVLTPAGASFTAARAPEDAADEFLASSDPWFRPVCATTGPDGALWVADMYRFLIEHPKFLPDAERAKIDPRAGAGLGRLYRVRPDAGPLRPWVRVRELAIPALVAALDSPNGVQRDGAMMELIWKADPAAVVPLEALLAKGSRPLARLHALCTLDALGKLSNAALAGALADADPTVRRHAARAAESRLADPALAAAVAKLAADPDVPVRVQVAYTLGAWRDAKAGAVLARLAFDAKGDPYLTAAAVSSLTTDNLPSFAAALFAGAGPEGPPPALVRDLFATAAAAGDALPGLLDAATKSVDGKYRTWQLTAATGALDALARRGKAWEKLPEPTRAALAPLVASARRTIDAPASTEGELLAAVPLLGRDPTARRDDLVRLAAQLAATRPAAVQQAALAALARQPDAAVPAALVAAWPGASPALRGRLLDTLLGRPAWAPALLDAVEKGTIPPGLIDAGRRQRLADHPDAAVRERAAKRFAGASDPDRAKVVEAARPALALAGDRDRGKAVFARACAACHALGGVGSAVGPDLAALANKSPLYLLTEILDPNRNVDSRYVEYRAETADGRTIAGLLAAETAAAVTLRGQQGKDDTILRADLVALRGTAKSLMPEGLEKDLPPRDLADLLAYLTTTDAPPKQLAGNTPAEVAVRDGAAALRANAAYVYGGAITFEADFGNLGYWHGEADHAVWHVRTPAAAAFDVYLDYACAPDSAGNALVLDGGDAALRGKVASTGGWDRYRTVKLGTLKLPAGAARISVRPDGPVRGALLDLRAIYLVPPGQTPVADKDASPAEQLRALTADLKAGDAAEEYRRIPRVFTITLAAGKANDAATVRAVLDAALPTAGDPLRDWQAVALGGGVVNGLSQSGVWPAARVAELTKDDATLAARWKAVLPRAHAMADDEKVPPGTRYDALRLVALDSWDAARPRLTKYLAKAAHPELQMGAVSGLADVNHADVGPLLAKALPDLTAANRALAVTALLRTPDRAAALLSGVEAGSVPAAWLTAAQKDALRRHVDEAVRTRAVRLLGP